MSEIQEVNQGISNKPSEQDDIQLSAKPFYYTWTLSNFYECQKFTDAKILSPEFEFAGTKWQLWLKAICKNDKLDKIKFRLIKSDKCDSGYYIKYKFSVLNADGSSVTKEAASTFWPGSVWGHRLSFKYRGKNGKASSFIIDDKLTVDCEFFVLSSEVMSNNRIAVDNAAISTQKHANNAENLIPISASKGLIHSRSSHPLSNTGGTESSSPSAHLYSIRNPAMECYPIKTFRKLTEIMFPVFFIFIVLMHACSNETSLNGKLMVNMTEVNTLIVDSTLKIRSIAEVLNLTDIKMKSSELLEWYQKNYNLSIKNFESSSAKISHALNSSTSDMYETATVNNSGFIENEH